MKNRPPVSREVLDEMHQLVTASLDDHLSAEQEIRLEELVGHDIAACDLYLNLIHESSILLTWAKHSTAESHPATDWQNAELDPASAASRSQEANQSQTTAVPVSPIFGLLGDAVHSTVGYFSQGMPFSYLVATVLVGLGILIGALIPVSNPVQIVRESTTLPSPLSTLHSSSPFVGRITGMVDCQWAEVGWVKRSAAPPKHSRQGDKGPGAENPKSQFPIPNSLVSLGDRFTLRSGLLEITYDTGAKVILQGPATYEVESASGGYLAMGKLTAKLEKKEEGRTRNEELSASRSSFLIPHSYFSITTPTATVTDLGTEFGVDVTEAGTTETHVFVGTVKFEGRGDAGGVPEQVLVAGQAARLDPSLGTVAVIDHNTDHFIRKMPLPKTAASRELIEQVDYADTFTANSPTRAGSNLILRELMLTDPKALWVEDCPGNPVRSWKVPETTAITTWPNDARWPGFRVQGSRSGLMEIGGDCHCGFEYDLRDDFVVQFDAVQTADLINVTIGESAHYTHDTPSLSLFIRAAGAPMVTPYFRTPGAPTPTPGVLAPEIGIYHPHNGEFDTGLRSGISAPHTWHNYAVRFNLPAKRLTVWIDRECRGSVDLDTLKDSEGRPALAGLTWTRRYVSIGGFSPPDDKRKVWFDNFRIGAPRDVDNSDK